MSRATLGACVLVVGIVVVGGGCVAVGIASMDRSGGGGESAWGHLPADSCVPHHTVGYANASATIGVGVCGPAALESEFGQPDDTVAMWYGVKIDGPSSGTIVVEPHHDRPGITYLHELGHALHGEGHTASGVLQPTTDVDIQCDLAPETREIAAAFNTTRVKTAGSCEVVVTPLGNVSAAAGV